MRLTSHNFSSCMCVTQCCQHTCVTLCCQHTCVTQCCNTRPSHTVLPTHVRHTVLQHTCAKHSVANSYTLLANEWPTLRVGRHSVAAESAGAPDGVAEGSSAAANTEVVSFGRHEAGVGLRILKWREE